MAPQLSANGQRLVNQVRMHRQIGTAARRRRVPRAQYPKAIEVSYGNQLVGVVRAARAAVQPALEHLDSLLKSAKAARSAARGDAEDAGDYADPTPRWFAGLPVMIENPAGSIRRWSDENDNTTGETRMLFDYGFIDGVCGADGDDVDVYLGPDESAPWVYIVHQTRAPDFEDYDEDKVMLGFASADAARDAYLAQYNDDGFFGGMSMMSMPAFREALAENTGGMISHSDSAARPTWRMDAGEGSRARALLDAARLKLTDAMHPNKLDALAGKFARTTSAWGKLQIQRQAKSALGIDVHTMDTNIPDLIDHFVSENVSLIKSLGNRTMDDVEKIVTRAITSGRETDDVTNDINERFNIGERHARLIARDQIGKLNGQIRATRHQELGLRRFIWRTVGDDRVRDEHEELEAQSEAQPFSYNDPPEEGLPGEPICCRCQDEPVYQDILDAVDGNDSDDSDDD